MIRALKKQYIYYSILIFLIYLVVVFVLSGFYNTIPLLILYASSVSWLSLGLSILLSLVTGALVALTGVSLYAAYQERKKCKEAGVLAGMGAFGGLAVGVCPLCITGLFPLIFSLIGVSFSFATLPFHGIEIQVLNIILLSFSLWALHKK